MDGRHGGGGDDIRTGKGGEEKGRFKVLYTVQARDGMQQNGEDMQRRPNQERPLCKCSP